MVGGEDIQFSSITTLLTNFLHLQIKDFGRMSETANLAIQTAFTIIIKKYLCCLCSSVY